jgi:hypothetical protein
MFSPRKLGAAAIATAVLWSVIVLLGRVLPHATRHHTAPPGGLKQDRNAPGGDRRACVGPDLRRGHYELAIEEPANQRLIMAFDELALAI